MFRFSFSLSGDLTIALTLKPVQKKNVFPLKCLLTHLQVHFLWTSVRASRPVQTGSDRCDLTSAVSFGKYRLVESDFSPFFFFLKEPAVNLKVFLKRLNAKFSSTCVLFFSQTSVQTTSIQHEKKKKFWIEPLWLSRAPPHCLLFSFFLPFSSPDANTQRERTRCKKSRHTSRGRVQICTFSLIFFSLFSCRRRQRRRRTKPHSDSPRCARRRRRGTFHGGKSANVAPVTHWLANAVFFLTTFSFFLRRLRMPRRSFAKSRKKKKLFSSANCRHR